MTSDQHKKAQLCHQVLNRLITNRFHIKKIQNDFEHRILDYWD